MAKSTPIIPHPSQINSRPWRSYFAIHPAAEIVRELTPAELRELADDIKKLGHIKIPLIFRQQQGCPSGLAVVDGRSRLDALQLLGWPYVEEDEGGNITTSFVMHVLDPSEDPYAVALSANLQRRHLSEEERRDAIKKYVAKHPEQSNRQVAKQFKVDHKTVGSLKQKMEVTGEISPVERTIGIDGKSRPAKRTPPDNFAKREARLTQTVQAQAATPTSHVPPPAPVTALLSTKIPLRLTAYITPHDAASALFHWLAPEAREPVIRELAKLAQLEVVARHDVRIKVCEHHGTRMLPGSLATVAVRPAPRLIAGHLSAADLALVGEWIGLNEAALVAHWNYQIDSGELIQRLVKLP
jgi:hypothetical protein